jgi:hypothetical protein
MTVFDLWKPIVATGIATHIWSTLAWTALPHHKPEWTRVPSEDELQDLIAEKKIPAGQYMFPFAESGKEATSEEFQQKNAKCRGMLIVWATPLTMGAAIVKTLLWFLAIAFTIGYLSSLALDPGEKFQRVIQFVTTAGLLAHVAAHFPHVFWFRRKISMEVVDGVIQALLTGVIFAALWPGA